MKKIIFLSLISLTSISSYALDLKVDDIIRIGDLMKQTQWYKDSEIISLTKISNDPSFQIILRADNQCLTSIISTLDSKALYVVPSSVEEIPCP